MMIRNSAFLLIAALTLLRPAAGQERTQGEAASSARNIVISPDEEYRIGSSDVVEVYILKAPELSRSYRVTADGAIEMPFLGRITAQKRTSQELAAAIAEKLRPDFLVDPQVSVLVKQVSRQFFIQGAVRTPGVYSIEGRPSLLELITIAGGLGPSYSTTGFIIRGVRKAVGAAADPETEPQYELKEVNVAALLRGDFSENPIMEPGDIVQIPPADVFFVSGEVKSPGSFPLREGTTLRQAISLAQGHKSTAALNRGVIFREEAGGQKREITVDVGAVMAGKNPDIAIKANDIVVIPNSKTKSALYPVLSAFGVNAAYIPTRAIVP
jgi:polysaccharide export outer membrane protein